MSLYMFPKLSADNVLIFITGMLCGMLVFLRDKPAAHIIAWRNSVRYKPGLQNMASIIASMSPDEYTKTSTIARSAGISLFCARYYLRELLAQGGVSRTVPGREKPSGGDWQGKNAKIRHESACR
ncbi:hypothetical protein FVI09_25160 [Escherichia coli]|nr:hypothetical protein [Escherichia coli]